MSYFEKDAIISGLGISRIGRRTGIPGMELTLEAARAAIEDAGLTANDIDGIATLGDTPLPKWLTHLVSNRQTRLSDSTPAECSFPSCRLFAPCPAAVATRAGLSHGGDARRVDDR